MEIWREADSNASLSMVRICVLIVHLCTPCDIIRYDFAHLCEEKPGVAVGDVFYGIRVACRHTWPMVN